LKMDDHKVKVIWIGNRLGRFPPWDPF
jgi:hypothetical protein